jgi:hypothetical protein
VMATAFAPPVRAAAWKVSDTGIHVHSWRGMADAR